MTKIFIVMGVVFVVLICLHATARADETTDDAWKKIHAGALVIDVRTPEEFAAGHLDGATNIVYDKTDELIRAIGVDTSKSVVLYCRSGRRSGIAQRALNTRGYLNIVNGGGLAELQSRQIKKD